MAVSETGTLAQATVFDGASAGALESASPPELNDLNGRVGVLRFTGLTSASVRYESATLTLGYTSFPADCFPCTILVHARVAAEPPAWSDSEVPPAYRYTGVPGSGLPLRNLESDLNLGRVIEVARTRLTAAPANPFTLTLSRGPLNQIAGLSRPPTQAEVTAALEAGGSTITPRTWDGSFSFSLNAILPAGASGAVLDGSAGTTPPALALSTETRQHTGMSTDYDALGRVDVCPTCGHISLRDFWVRDAEIHRLVCPRCAEPVDNDTPNRVDRGERPLINED